jgi:hypothetical protein
MEGFSLKKISQSLAVRRARLISKGDGEYRVLGRVGYQIFLEGVAGSPWATTILVASVRFAN